MDTKRCQRCHKVLRADAQSCSRCGYVFSQAAPVKRSESTTNGSRRTGNLSTMPTNPPASPHRAGHYSGLHPEDQPFQSSFMPAMPVQRSPITTRDLLKRGPGEGILTQRSPITTRDLLKRGPGEDILPTVTASSASSPVTPEPEQLPQRQVATPSPQPLPAPQRNPNSPSPAPVPQRQFVSPLLPPEPAPYEPITLPSLGALHLPRKRRQHVRIVPLLLLVSCLFFLLATSILVFLFLDWRPPVTTHPASRGLSTQATVQRTSLSAPKLQLSASQIDFGAGLPGTKSHETLTLTGARGEHIDWRSGSDSSWLTIAPDHGTVSGSATATLTVDRGIWAPQTYTGHITFYQQGSYTPLTLTVTMTVNHTPANLVVTPASLSFFGSITQNPPGQTLIMQNIGGQALDWTASIGAGGNWLSASSLRGHLGAGLQQAITVSANSTGLSVGSYQGNLTFSYAGGSPFLQILVTLTVSPTPLPSMLVQSTTLKFNAVLGSNPPPQTFSITNTGNASLNWAITEDLNAAAFAPVSPARGTVAPGKSATVTVAPNVTAQATAGVIKALITVSDTDKGTTVQSQQVTVIITISNQAVISVSPTSLTCSNTTGFSQLLTITNTGSTTLNWTLLQPSQPLPSWLSLDIPGGKLSPGTTEFVTVTCNSTGLSTGTYSYTLVASDTDPGTPVVSQNIPVVLTVS